MEDKFFDLRNKLQAERAQLMSDLSANTSPIGDWKIVKIYEARMAGLEDPYNADELMAQRAAVREHINKIDETLSKLN